MAGPKPSDGRLLRLARAAHAWCGVLLALFVAAVALSGAASAFRAELLAPTLPAAASPAAPAATLGAALQAYQAGDPSPVAVVLFNMHGAGLHTLFLRDGRRVFIDPAGRPLAPRPGIDWDAWVHRLHAELLGGPKGHQAVGVIGVLATGMGLSGLAVWAAGRPRRPTWPRSARRADLLALHRDWSAALSLLILIETATGAMLVYDEPIRRALHIPPPPRPETAAADAPPDWRAIVEGVRNRYPRARIDRIVAPGEPRRPYEVGIAEGGGAGTATVHVGPDGAVLAVVDERALSPGARFMDFLGALHSGQPLGPLGKAFLVVSGAGLALTSLIGAWTFLARRRLTPRRPGRGSAV